jgi:hypothetical protein
MFCSIRGNPNSADQTSIDASRVIGLAERLLFKLLGGDTAWQGLTTFREAEYLAAEQRLLRQEQQKGEPREAAV